MGTTGGGTVRHVLIALLIAALAPSLVPTTAAHAQVTPPPPPAPAPFAVSLTATGFVPDRVTVGPGQTIVITNDAGATRTVTSGGDGTFDSGPVLPGGRYVIAFPRVGTWRATDDAAPTPHTATITVGRRQLEGDPFSSADSAIPDQEPPDGPVLVHPALGIEVTRNRILIGFTQSATVAQANAALQAVGLTIVGGNRDARVLITEVADAGTPGLEYMQSALDLLRTRPGVRTAAYDASLNPETALPRPADPDPGTSVGEGSYEWQAFVNDDETIRGEGGNYGLESARFPQAWNWLDTIRKGAPGNRAASATVVLDGGFDTRHPDLREATLLELCTTDLRCTDNPTGLDSAGDPETQHGTQTAGVVGATFDRGLASSPNSDGTVGGDPLSDLFLVPYFTDAARDSSDTVSFGSFLSVLDLILDKKNEPPFEFSHLRVINLSAGFGFTLDKKQIPFFERFFGSDLCGPGVGDDDTTPPAQRVACTPNTKDIYITEFRAAAELVRPLADRLAANNVLLVVAAGNDSSRVGGFCATRPRPDPEAPCDQYEPISTTNTDPFGYLASIWTGGVPPWVLVEGNVATPKFLQRSPFSNTDGTISAAGTVLVPYVNAADVATYKSEDGTSFAAPLVSAAAGLLSSLTPSWQTVRELLVERGPTDLANSTTPRLDVFASLLGLPAASGIDALLDVNDTSPDGNRRVVYDDSGQPTGEDLALGSTQLRTDWSAPDGRIDMRDFRRYRDGWLDTCVDLAGCPEFDQISLDGSDIHPKRDLNLDGCFFGQNVPQCINSEGVFARIDFNGDGTLLPRAFPTLLRPDGTPAARGSGARMTDLDVFQTRFGQGPNADTEGWTADDLDALLTSADVELRLDQLWADGAESAEVTVGTLDRVGPRRTLTPRGPGDVRVYTMPIQPTPAPDNNDLLQVRVVAQLPGNETAVYLSEPLEAKAGQDLVVVPCTDQLVVTADPAQATPGGASLITASLVECSGRPVANSGIDFEIAGGPNGSSLTVVSAVTDANGVARTVFQYPDGVNSPAQVTARAYPAIDGGERLERTVDLGPAEDFVIHYRFRQTILDYQRTSTNDWGPGQDDCDGPTDAGSSPATCFTATQEIMTKRNGLVMDGNTVIGLFPYDLAPGELERRGSITPNGSGGATIDDQVRSFQASLVQDPSARDIDGVTLTTRVEEWFPGNPTARTTHIYDSPIAVSGQPSAREFADIPAVEVPTVDFTVTDQRLRVNNLRAFADSYAISQAAYTLQRGTTVLPEETNPDLPVPNLYQALQQIPTDLALVPRADSSNFAWDWNPDAPLDFTANGDGTYQPTSWCGTRQRVFDNASDPGFWNDSDPAIETTNPNDWNEVFAGPYRDPDEQRPDRQPGDRAAPRHTGSVTSRFEFVAAVTRPGDPPPDLQFPACTETDPTPFFGWQPAAPVEGQEIEFTDLSSYADGALGWTWRFADPQGSSPAYDKHVFSDNGTYPVDFTVTDSSAVSHTSDTADVVVKNAPPTLGALEFLDGGRRIRYQVDDAGKIDRQQLEVRLTSPTPGWPSGGIADYTAPPTDPVTTEPALGAWTDTISLPDNLTPGVYFVVLTVLDKDGGKATRSFSLAVPVPVPVDPAGFRAARSVEQPAQLTVPTQLAVPAQVVAPDPFVNSPVPPEPVPAYVVDRGDASTGELVAVRNATRTAGTPSAAALDPGDGRPPVTLSAGASVDLAYFQAGTPTLRIGAPGASIQAGSAVTITGSSIPAGISYEGVTSAPVGAAADVVARATRAGGTGLPGVIVRFTLGSESIDAVSGADGRARAELPVTGPTGPRDLVVQALPDGTAVTIPFTVTANALPTVNTGGPYTIGAGSPLNLTSSATDTDAGEQATLVFQWDLDGDGAFDDASGPEPSLNADQVRIVVCGGTCTAGEVAPITLRVTDVKGGRAVASTTVTLVRDFALTINPANATLVPNANVSFTVSVVTTNGFSGPVTLGAPGLPAGVTATFDPPTVTPNGTSLLNVRAGANFTAQDFSLVVRGTSGSIVRETGTDLSLEFGLIPQCFGAVTGRVTDQETGLGIAGLSVFGATTDANGNYSASGLVLDTGNAPRPLFVTTLGAEFYPISPAATTTIACGLTSRLDIVVLRRQFGAVVGTITGIDVDGTPLGPINNAQYALNRRTGPDGRYAFSNLTLDADNAPLDYTVFTSATGFHPGTGTVRISAGTTSTLDITMRKVCTASARVRVLDQRTGRPVPGARVDTGQATQGYTADANGIVIITGIGLGAPDNRPVARGIRAFTPTGISPQGTATKSVVYGRCGAQVPVDIAIPFPRRVETTVNVLVLDDAGAPVPGAIVNIGATRYSQPTGPDGRLTVTHLLGIDVPPTQSTTITAAATGLLSPPAIPITLTEGQPSDATVTLVRRKFGTAEGTVRDRATGAPIAGVVVNGITTGPDGRYQRGNLNLNGLNQPATASFSATDQRTPRQYWNSVTTQVTVRADEVTQVPDLLMTRVCEPATIRGRVVNAATREPIAGALVRVSSTLSALTDVDGRFVIGNIPVGTNNENLDYSVTASKSGFLTATKTATVSCAADIVVDFGRDGDGVGTISGRVTDVGGSPVNQARVSTSFGGSTRTDSNGNYTIANAPAGEGGVARDWIVRVLPAPGSRLEPGQATATVRRDEITTLDFVLGSLADDPPVAATFAITVDPGAVPITLAGSDPTNDPLTFRVTTPPTNGSLTGTAPDLVYTPNDGFAGVERIEYVANDGTNDSAPGVITITVRGINQAPVARVTGSATADEGTRVDLSGATSSDLDGTIAGYAWELDGDGLFDDATGATSSVRLLDNGVATVGLRVTDDRGSTGTTTFAVTFRNVDPTVQLDPPAITARSIELSGTVDDPGSNDTFTGTIDFGDGAGPRALSAIELDAGDLFVAHTYSADGTYTISVRVCDDDAGCVTTTTPVTVVGSDNAPPVARITGPIETPEGTSTTLSGATSSDTDGTIAGYAWDLDDDGQFDDASTPTTPLPCPDDGVRTIRLQVTDDGGATATTSATVTCTNVAPSVTAIAGAALEPGGSLTRNGTFGDPGADQWTATVDWGEGGGAEPLRIDGFTFTLDHVFSTIGTFTVTVEVCDDDGDCGSATTAVHVAPASPDPQADLSIVKRHEGAFTAGGAATYTIEVTNAGPDVATGVVVTDTLPTGLGFLGTSSSGWTCSPAGSAPVACTLAGGLAVGAGPPLVLDVAVSPTAPIGVDAITNRATVAGATTDPNPDNDSDEDPTTIVAPAPPQADLSAGVTVSERTPSPGDSVTWTIVVANAGPDDSGQVTVELDVPNGLRYEGIGALLQGIRVRQLDAGWTCVPGSPLVCTIPDIAADASSSLVVRFVVDAQAEGVLPGNVTVRSLAADPNTDDNSVPVELTVQQVPPPSTTTTTTTTSTTTTTTTLPTTTTTVSGSPPGPTTTVPGPRAAPATPVGTPPPPTFGPISPAGGQLPATGGGGLDSITIAVQLLAAGAVLLLLSRRSSRRRQHPATTTQVGTDRGR